MKLVQGDPVSLDLTGDEVVRLAFVSMALLLDSDAPCAPSHWFCAGALQVKDKTIGACYRREKGRSRAWFIEASRRVFDRLSDCPDVDPMGFSSDEMREWIVAALSRTDLQPDYVQTVRALGLTMGMTPRLDA